MPSPGEPSIARTVATLVRGRRVLVQLTILGGLIGGLTGLLSERLYVSRVTFLPKGSEESASGLALAASQFGVTLPNKTGDWWPAIYVEVLNSRSGLADLAADTFVVEEEEGRRATLMDLLEVPGSTPAQRQARAVFFLREIIAATEDKKLGGVKVAVATQWPSVSLAVLQRLVDGVNEFNIRTRRTLAAAEREFVDEQAGEAERILRASEDQLQAFLLRNRTVAAPELTFERDRLQREVTMRMQVYTSLMQNREQARLREVRNTPVITLIESPRLAVLPEPRGTVVRGLLGAVVGALVAALWLLGLRGAGAAGGDPEWSEVRRLLVEAFPRLMRRWA